MKNENSRNLYLPVNKDDMKKRGWNHVDIVLISGDAYVDHPSFGIPMLGRMLEAHGYRVGIIAQPRWDNCDDFLKLGVPKLCCMIGSGNIDSMVAHYTANIKLRSNDEYSPGGKAGFRPDRAATTYSNRARQAFGKEVPIILGGLEGSLRRFAHYDFWNNKIRKPIILDAKADLLVYGMGELQTLEIADRLRDGESLSTMTDIKGTVFSFDKSKKDAILSKVEYPIFELPTFEETADRDKSSNTPTESGKMAYAKAFQMQMLHENPLRPECLIQRADNRFVLQNPQPPRLTPEQFDEYYDYPYTRLAHPDYDKDGGIPALKEVQFSITSNRGCLGACSFCAITSHQGRMIQIRTKESLVKEATTLSKMKEFKGYIHDLGGPTANFQGPACKKQMTKGPCDVKQCLFPEPCNNLIDTHEHYIDILDAVAAVPGVKKVFIRSGIRFDYLMRVSDPKTRNRFMKHLIEKNVSGQLKVAPEHVDPQVLDMMGKPKVDIYLDFLDEYKKVNDELGLKQYTIPYFIAAHPGSTLESAINLALHAKSIGFVPDQGQEYYPTPGTVSTCMYYTGIDPRPGRNFAPVYIPQGHERRLQRAILQYNKPENAALVREALIKAKREDLINVLKAPYRGKGKTFRAPIVREDRQKNSSWASKSNKFNSKDRKNNRY
jgi:uncharacterized radical SAM protein YgiQ